MEVGIVPKAVEESGERKKLDKLMDAANK